MKDKNQYEDELAGVLEHIIYRNEENGYSVVRIKPHDSPRETVVTGTLIGVDIGENLILKGNWVIHPEYGQQFQAISYQVEQPETTEGIVKFLSSSLIKGIGPKTAEKIVNEFGEKSLDIIENEPSRLEQIDGIGRTKRELIEKGWNEKKGIKNVMLFLHKYDIKTTLAIRIYKTYGENVFQILRSNPYQLSADIHGVGFKTADNIARNFGLDKDSVHRIEAGLTYLILQFAEEGHCYAKREILLKRSKELLDVKPVQIEQVLGQLLEKKNLVAEGEAIYHPVYYHSERSAANKLLSIIKSRSSSLCMFQDVNWEKVFTWLQSKRQINYTGMQKRAVRECLTHKISVLTGGPGTGKSTITAALTSILEAKKIRTVLAAPTGRAAKRLSEVTGSPAQTIHRLLEFSWQDGLQFRRNEENPLEASVIIIDEASMLDIIMLNHFLKAVRIDTHLIFIGDIDQLPSVGAGYVLHDMITSGVIPVNRLDVIFRQQSDSSIITNAHRIRQGLRPVFARNSGDFYFFGSDTPSKAADTILELVIEKIPRTFGYNPHRQIQVLAPMHKGEMGISELNKRLQLALNPYSGEGRELALGEKTYRVNDRIIQLRNNYEKEVFNGDLGIIEAVDIEMQLIQVSYEERIVDYELYELDQITHSYAISIHKSQGSEFTVVVSPFMMQHYIMLQRNLLYTAITRARELVVLVGNQQAIDTALRNNKIKERNTMLAELLHEV